MSNPSSTSRLPKRGAAVIGWVLSLFTRPAASTLDEPLNTEESHTDSGKETNMAKVIKSVESALYFIEGKGFIGTAAQATRFSDIDAGETVKCLARTGARAVVENEVVINPNIKQNANGISFAPNFIRKGDVRADGSVAANAKNPSSRRFATRAEAQQHIDRFVKIEGHIGGYITESRDAVNAWINPESGFTNPEIGKKRYGGDRKAKV